jgi:phage FluMu gp28-like protein
MRQYKIFYSSIWKAIIILSKEWIAYSIKSKAAYEISNLNVKNKSIIINEKIRIRRVKILKDNKTKNLTLTTNERCKS